MSIDRPSRGFVRTWQDRLLCEWWSIGICDRPIGTVLEEGALGPVRWMSPARGAAYLADPFPWPGTGLILCEEVPLATGIGRIVALRTPSGAMGFAPAARLLDDGIHRSYPYAWRHDGADYLLPEAAAGGATILYRLRADGTLHALPPIAPRRRLVDASIFAENDRLWIAATDLAFGTDNNLCLYHADRPEGPWLAHRDNPVIRDRRTARGGGTVFRHRGRLYRPAQDCTKRYGGALVIAEVLALTPSAYAERIVCRLDPDPNGPFPHGLHTLSTDGERCFVDGKRMVFVPGIVAAKIRNRLMSFRPPGLKWRHA